jgi:antirestriction protein ArdC
MKRDLYADVTAKILAELEKGAAPWIKPWKATAGANMPMNAITRRPYSGCNVPLLWMERDAKGYATQQWLTYKQATEIGGNVRKGEKSSTVFFVKRLDFRAPDAQPGEISSKDRSVMMLRAYAVFNIAQCDGMPDCLTNWRGPVQTVEARDALADAFVRTTKADVREGHGEAYFAPGADFISMPAFRAFKGADHFYGTLFHELGHWTGHASRLDRDLKNAKGSKLYAAEELVAELTSAFLCAEFGFDGDLRHAGYIENWIKLLRDDSRAYFRAAAQAQKGADYLRQLANAAEPEADDMALAA